MTPDTRTTSLTSASGTLWTVSATAGRNAGRVYPAAVPGEVHTDLLAAGVIPDPFDGDNEAALAWIGLSGWVYRATFDWPGGAEKRHDLVADGLDTVATVTLNGTELAKTCNQHRSYRFDVASLLVDGANELVVEFEGPVTAAERLSDEIGPRPHTNPHPFNAIRKMASAYGWDWGPDLAGAGIWRRIGIESWDDVRVAAVRPLVSVVGNEGLLDCHVDLEWDAHPALPSISVGVQVGDSVASADVPAGQSNVCVSTRVPEVVRWWPRDYGEQALYNATVTLVDASVSGALDQRPDRKSTAWQGRIGFRNVRISTTPDARGSEFVILVNDQPIYVKGANWIPDDALLTRLTPETYRASITEAFEAGINLLRVWGGGIYESDNFYRVCDELGILVWQDFLFACAAYSEEEPLRSEVEAEARQAITRLTQHPSLALWNGNNENIWGFVEWGWRPELDGRTWGDGYYTELLPDLVAELAPHTPYSPASPFSFAPYHHPNDYRHGTMHIWDVWNQIDYDHYRDYPARFVSEFGFQGPPGWSTLTSVVHDKPLDPYGPQMLVHQKAADGNGKLERGLGTHLPKWSTEPVADMADWHWTTQLNQARAVSYGIEHFRSHYPLNRGALVWQLNDNWPVISWAAVDSYGIRKPLWHALRAVFADRLVTVQPRRDDLGVDVPTLIMHNDSAEPWDGELVVSRRSTDPGSAVLAEQRLPFHVGARAALSSALDGDIITPADPRQEFLEIAGGDAGPTFWYFVEDTELMLAPVSEALRVTVAVGDDGYRVGVTATALAKDLALFPDRLDPTARVDSCLVTLVAGQTHTFEVTSGPLDEVALTSKPVLRCVNDLVNQG